MAAGGFRAMGSTSTVGEVVVPDHEAALKVRRAWRPENLR
jgi:hypothetical protein